MLFTAIVVRVFVKLLDEDEPFIVLAAAGLTTQFAVQAMINIAVNVHLAPSKGMTLPFISYGGSSMLALVHGLRAVAGVHPAEPVSDAVSLCGQVEYALTAKLFVLAAGGTGGHMVPAHALARELSDGGIRSHW